MKNSSPDDFGLFIFTYKSINHDLGKIIIDVIINNYTYCFRLVRNIFYTVFLYLKSTLKHSKHCPEIII